MKLAFFSSIVPDGNPTTGYEIANEAIVAGLTALGHEVRVFGFKLHRQLQDADLLTSVLDTLNVENTSASKLRKLQWLIRAHINRLPISAAKLIGTSQGRLLDEISRHGPFDGHIVNSYQMAAAFPKILNAPYVYVAHNVEHRSASENALSAETALERYLYHRDARLLKNIEAKLCSNARHVWTLSHDDLTGHMVGEHRGGVLSLVAPQVDPSARSGEKEFDVGLIGTWSWQPNFVGLKWFLEEIVPDLPSELRIAVAGSVPDGVAALHPSVTFLGRVDSASEFLNSVRVVPLVSRGGTGVQLKTIEALQSGYACVATSSSLRGIDELPKNCKCADEAQDFSAAIAALVSQSLEGNLPNTDGSKFFNSQKSAMMRELQLGLASLS